MKFLRIFLRLFSRLKEVHPSTARVFIFLISCFGCALILAVSYMEIFSPSLFTKGEVATHTVRSPQNLLIEDVVGTERRKEAIVSTVPKVFTLQNNVQGKVTDIIRSLILFAVSSDFNDENKKAQIKESLGFDMSNQEWAILADTTQSSTVEQTVLQLVLPILKRGIIANNNHMKDVFAGSLRAVLYDTETKTEQELSPDSFFWTPEEAEEALESSFLSFNSHVNPSFDSLVKKLAMMCIKPNVFYNTAETEQRIAQAKLSIEPNYYKVKRGEVIVRAGDIVTEVQEQKLLHLHEKIKSSEVSRRFLAYIILSSIIILSLYFFVVRFWENVVLSNCDLAITSLCLIGSLFLIKLFSVLSTSLSSSFNVFEASTFIFTTPVAAAGMILQVTIGASSVFLFVVSFALLTGIFLDYSWMMLVLIVLGNLIGAVTLKTCCRRSVFLSAGLRIALVNVLVVLCFVMLYPDYAPEEIANRMIWAFIGGLFSAILAAGLTPVIEAIGGYATDSKLLELASLDHPLLRELSIQAPGTWTHSMMLGQMSEAAAEAVGANPLLARVGAYYHDIGKAKKPAYFVENQTGENRHDKLTPSMSALIIKSHVKDGLEMAQEHKLPKIVVDFIPQHHGTSLIRYFYDKALKELPEGEEISENHYRYSGPRPQNKECAILMLADSVEAASRTLSEPTPAKIQGLTQKIINNVFASGELDQSSLTLKDLHLIARSFTRVLTGIYHKRIEYSESAEKIREERNEKSDRQEEQGINREADQTFSTPNTETLSSKKNGEGANKKANKQTNKEALKRLGI